MKWLVPVVFMFLLVGCLSHTMSSWEGKHRDDLIQKWGPPNQEATLSKGGTSLVYNVNADGSPHVIAVDGHIYRRDTKTSLADIRSTSDGRTLRNDATIWETKSPRVEYCNTCGEAP